MIDYGKFKKIALAFAEVVEQPHFEKQSFRVNKKIFATYNAITNQATIKLSDIDQEVFSKFDTTIIYPVPNKWGKQGWTIIELNKINEAMLIDALTTSYCTVAPKRLSEKYSK